MVQDLTGIEVQNLYPFFLRWREVENESGLQLLHKTGVLDMVSVHSKRANLLKDYAQASKEAGIP